MIQLNKYDDKPIIHKCEPDRVGEVMTEQEIHEFGLALLIVYLYRQKGNLISSNGNLSNDYPHLVAENPKKELLYIWVKTEMYPTIPSVISIENHEEVINISKQFNAIPVFAGIMLTCDSTEENVTPKCGGGYIAQFTGLKEL